MSGVSVLTARRLTAVRLIWQVVTRRRAAGSPGLADRVGALPRLTLGALTGRYPVLTRGRLALIVLAVAYLVSPVDALPELLLGPDGLLDDGVVALWLGGALMVETERFLAWERSRSLP